MENFPNCTIICEDCSKEFSGAIGPLDKSYLLVEHIWPWNGTVLAALKRHHLTFRTFNGGHSAYAVEDSLGRRVGRLHMSTHTQRYDPI